jgi:rhodanese-related sulfurtransferase
MGKTSSMQPDDVPSITADELSDDFLLVDVRGEAEWEAGHSPDALHVPADELSARLSEIPIERDLVVVCHGGGRSARSTVLLNEHGYRARKLVGGMPAWAASGRAIESDNGLPPDVD